MPSVIDTIAKMFRQLILKCSYTEIGFRYAPFELKKKKCIFKPAAMNWSEWKIQVKIMASPHRIIFKGHLDTVGIQPRIQEIQIFSSGWSAWESNIIDEQKQMSVEV